MSNCNTTALPYRDDIELSPFSIMRAVVKDGIGEVPFSPQAAYAIPGDVLEELREDVRMAELAGTAAPGAAFTVSGWRRKGEQARRALGLNGAVDDAAHMFGVDA